MKKFIDEYKCPCCGIKLFGNYDGDIEKFYSNFGEDVLYEIFRFDCPNTYKKICMVETTFMDTKIFWEQKYEFMMDEYEVFSRTKSRNLFNNLINMYHPLASEVENKLFDIRTFIEKNIGNGKVFTMVVPKFLSNIIDVYFDDKLVKKWIIDDRFYDVCKGNKYPSLLAEINIVNELKKWYRYQSYSIYPTAMDCFNCLYSSINWSHVDQMVLI